MDHTTRIRCSGAQDLLAVPALMLEFQPEESVVAVCLRGSSVKFCARSDLGMPDDAVDATAAQLMQAMRNTLGREFVLLGYGRDVASVRDALVALEHRLGGMVSRMIAANHESFWVLEEGRIPEHPGEPYDIEESAVAAHAVFEGVQLGRTRAEAMATVQPPPARLRGEVGLRLETAFERVLPLEPDARMELFGDLLESRQPLDADEAAELAALLQVPDCQGEFLGQLSTVTASRFQARLLEARQATDEECEAEVLGPLALASWVGGRGAQANECVAQLEDVAPESAFLKLLHHVLADAVPPAQWDRW